MEYLFYRLPNESRVAECPLFGAKASDAPVSLAIRAAKGHAALSVGPKTRLRVVASLQRGSGGPEFARFEVRKSFGLRLHAVPVLW